jgi:hypothetical protein
MQTTMSAAAVATIQVPADATGDVNELTLDQAVALLKEHKFSGNGRFFGVTFIKRGNRKLRKMVCRFSVHKYVRGGHLAYKPEEKGLLSVFDVDTLGYKQVNLWKLLRLRIDGVEYTVRED